MWLPPVPAPCREISCPLESTKWFRSVSTSQDSKYILGNTSSVSRKRAGEELMRKVWIVVLLFLLVLHNIKFNRYYKDNKYLPMPIANPIFFSSSFAAFLFVTLSIPGTDIFAHFLMPDQIIHATQELAIESASRSDLHVLVGRSACDFSCLQCKVKGQRKLSRLSDCRAEQLIQVELVMRA